MKRLLFGAAFCVSVVAVRSAEPAAAKEPATQLSPFEVRANSVQFKHWIKVGSPNFIVYTDAEESEATTVLREFEMLGFAEQVLFGRKAARFGPTILILPTASSDWYKLESKGKVEWQSAVTAVGVHIADTIVVQHDWQSEGLGIARCVYSALLMERMEIEGPFWFDRGAAHFFETVDIDGDKVAFGHLTPRVRELDQGAWLPWGNFFEVTSRSAEFRKENKVGRFEAQAAIFIQYIFAHQDRSWLGRLAAWLDYLNTGAPPTEAKFKAIFDQDWTKWQQTLEAYMSNGRYAIFNLKVPAEVLHYTETRYKLPVKEMRELFVLVQILAQDVPESRASLDALLAKGVESETLRDLLLEACCRYRRKDAAMKVVRELIGAGSKNPRVYREADALATADAGPLSLDLRYGPELAEVRKWDRRGLELEPFYSNLNESLAMNEACASVVDQQSITTIEECYARVKGRNSTDRIVLSLAIALWRIGETQTAIDLASKLVDDEGVAERHRKMATELLERIKTEPKPASVGGK